MLSISIEYHSARMYVRRLTKSAKLAKEVNTMINHMGWNRIDNDSSMPEPWEGNYIVIAAAKSGASVSGVSHG